MKYIFVDSRDKEDYIGLVEENRLVEFYVEKSDDKYSVGNIYRGRVENIVKGIDSAFVDIGHYKNGYLYIKDAIPLENLYEDHNLKINDVLREGEDVIVQIEKEGKGDKGPKLTTHITIPGTFIVLTPFSNRINVSRKIDKYNSNRLRKYGKKIQVDDIGFVIRTIGKDVSEDKILDEYNNLFSLYKKILREKNFLPCPKLIYKDMDFLYKMINQGKYLDYKVVVNDKELYKSLLELDDSILVNIKDRLLLDRKFKIETRKDLYSDLNRALKKEVELDNGGSIVIEKTEAMTVVDVNSSAYVKGMGLDDTILDINLEAAKEIARQIRLRNISGIIIIDFIDFRDKSLEEEFLMEFNKELLKDMNKANIIGMTKLGLVELTRRKTRVSDLEFFEKRCSKCNSLIK